MKPTASLLGPEALDHPIHLLPKRLDHRKVTRLHGTALSSIQGSDQNIPLGLEMASQEVLKGAT